MAFANTSGGVMVLGVKDGTKKVKGVRDVVAEEERLASLIADSISPKVVPSMEVPWRKTQLLGGGRFCPASVQRNRGLTRSSSRRCGATTRVSSLDEQPMPDLNSEAIDFRAAAEFFKPIRKLTLHGL
ncbi:MAG TPA: ATP-binding protein [Blastocatellia bacterium]